MVEEARWFLLINFLSECLDYDSRKVNFDWYWIEFKKIFVKWQYTD